MAAAVPILAVASAGTSAVSSIMQGNAAAEAGRMQAEQAEEAAFLARTAATGDARNARVIGERHLGGMRAAYSASGVDINQGSVLDVLADSSANIERDAQNILLRGEISANAYKDQAALDRRRAGAATTAGYMGAASSILSGGAKVLKNA